MAGSAAGAVFLYTYADVGSLASPPDMHEPTWALPGKRLSAAAEVAATILADVGFAAAPLDRRRAFVTKTQAGALQWLEACHRARARVEDRVRCAKDTGLGRLPATSASTPPRAAPPPRT